VTPAVSSATKDDLTKRAMALEENSVTLAQERDAAKASAVQAQVQVADLAKERDALKAAAKPATCGSDANCTGFDADKPKPEGGDYGLSTPTPRLSTARFIPI
jgi:hypothetical protein